jgi:hypothetical protein
MRRSLEAEGAPAERELDLPPPPGRTPLELVVVPEPDEVGGGESGTTRRTAVTRALLVLAGIFGAGYAGTKLPEDGSGAPASSAEDAQTLELYVRNVRFVANDATGGTLPAGRELETPHGTITDAGGRELGELTAGLLPGSNGEIEVQRFTFPDGTLIGMGSGGLDEVEYAVVGGTGRFAGASGSYAVRLSPGARGEDAEFQVTVTGAKGVSDGS